MATTHELEQLLADLSLSRFLPKFKDEEIDDSCLAGLDEDDLKGLGLPLGPRTRFKQALSDRQASSRATSRAATPTPLEPAAEAFGGDDGGAQGVRQQFRGEEQLAHAQHRGAERDRGCRADGRPARRADICQQQRPTPPALLSPLLLSLGEGGLARRGAAGRVP